MISPNHRYDYYPFGLTFNEYQNQEEEGNDFLFNGKELQRDLNLDWYDYGARMYDASIGRWHVVDPLSELYFDKSTYVYVANNPIKLIDPNGMSYKSYMDETYGEGNYDYRGQAAGTWGNSNNYYSEGASNSTLGNKSLTLEKGGETTNGSQNSSPPLIDLSSDWYNQLPYWIAYILNLNFENPNLYREKFNLRDIFYKDEGASDKGWLKSYIEALVDIDNRSNRNGKYTQYFKGGSSITLIFPDNIDDASRYKFNYINNITWESSINIKSAVYPIIFTNGLNRQDKILEIEFSDEWIKKIFINKIIVERKRLVR